MALAKVRWSAWLSSELWLADIVHNTAQAVCSGLGGTGSSGCFDFAGGSSLLPYGTRQHAVKALL